MVKANLQLLQQLTDSSGDARRKLSGVLITLYGAISSGSFLFISNQNLRFTNIEKLMLIIFILSSVKIVLIAILEVFVDYSAKTNVYKSYVERVKKGEGESTEPLIPSRGRVFLLKYIPATLLILVIINIATVGVYSLIRILSLPNS